MMPILGLALAVILFVWFADLVMFGSLRLLAFLVGLGFAAYWQAGLAAWLVRSETLTNPRRAAVAAWLAWLLLVAAALRIILRRVRRVAPGDAAAVAWDIAVAALGFTLIASAAWAAPAWISGAPLRWFTPVLLVLAAVGAALDLLLPRLLVGVARRFR